MEISYIKRLDNRQWDTLLIGRRDLGEPKDLVPVISLVETKTGIIVFHHYHDPIVDAVKNPMEASISGILKNQNTARLCPCSKLFYRRDVFCSLDFCQPSLFICS